jgi:hypothetical protein
VSEPRDFDDPRYKAWRKAVYKRDRWKCRMPGCPGTDRRLNAHHIRRWADAPALRYVVGNGVSLCRTCHKRIWGREDEFEVTFLALVTPVSADATIALLLARYGVRRPEEAQG